MRQEFISPSEGRGLVKGIQGGKAMNKGRGTQNITFDMTEAVKLESWKGMGEGNGRKSKDHTKK